MYKVIEMHMPQGPQWHSDNFKLTLPGLPNESHEVFWRNPVECAAFLAGNPTFAEDMDFVPKEIFEADGLTRIYHEMPTGDIWNELQVNDTP